MPIVLCRVDERLIHGQVVVGWGGPLRVERIIVIDDELAQSAWEQELYVLGVPDGLEAEFHSVDDARASMAGWAEDAPRTVLLFRDVATLARLAENGGLCGQQVNLGGIHHAPGRRQVLPYLFLNRDEEAELRRVADQGIVIAAQDLPGSRSILLDQLLAA